MLAYRPESTSCSPEAPSRIPAGGPWVAPPGPWVREQCTWTWETMSRRWKPCHLSAFGAPLWTIDLRSVPTVLSISKTRHLRQPWPRRFTSAQSWDGRGPDWLTGPSQCLVSFASANFHCCHLRGEKSCPLSSFCECIALQMIKSGALRPEELH